MRTTLSIDDDVLQAARTLAAEMQISLGTALSLLARRGLRPSVQPRDGGLPVFDVEADAPVLTPAHVREALEEE